MNDDSVQPLIGSARPRQMSHLGCALPCFVDDCTLHMIVMVLLQARLDHDKCRTWAALLYSVR
jgi:hypothetical protein